MSPVLLVSTPEAWLNSWPSQPAIVTQDSFDFSIPFLGTHRAPSRSKSILWYCLVVLWGSCCVDIAGLSTDDVYQCGVIRSYISVIWTEALDCIYGMFGCRTIWSNNLWLVRQGSPFTWTPQVLKCVQFPHRILIWHEWSAGNRSNSQAWVVWTEGGNEIRTVFIVVSICQDPFGVLFFRQILLVSSIIVSRRVIYVKALISCVFKCSLYPLPPVSA